MDSKHQLAEMVDELDIVVALSGNSPNFLESWRHFIQPFHIIVIFTGDPSKGFKIPSDFDLEVYNRNDIKQILGPRAACISPKESACRCFGWLVSRKKYVLTISEDCLVASRPESKEEINAIQQHLLNLRSPSTPFFFNTLYDPYREGTDFVRGYPFSLREGVPTAVSHGLWLNVPDYDAPTSLVKPNERNNRFVDTVLTVPKTTLFPMSSYNLAFNRDLIGPSMYFPVMGEGQPLGIYDDMWAGWCAKVICDHLGYGIKTGLPYVWREKTSSAFANLKKEYRGIFWQEEIIPFFQSLQLSPSATTTTECYMEIASQVKEKLAKVDPYFSKVSDAMTMWVEAWIEINNMKATIHNTYFTNDSKYANDY